MAADPHNAPVSDETPIELEGLRVAEPPASATGLPAVVNSLRYDLREMGMARTAQSWGRINQRDGFDCPSCAWADPVGQRPALDFCENGAKAMADDATLRRLPAEFFAAHSVEELSRQSDYWLNAQGRLTQPLMLRSEDTHYRPLSWQDAFDLVGSELRQMEWPNQAVFYTSGKASNEAAYLFQLFARLLGTNNLPDCSNMCHESSGVGLTQTLGAGKSTLTLEDLESAECILVIGQNPGTNHPRMLASLETAKRRGSTILAVNPLREVGLLRFRHPQHPLRMIRGTHLADEYLQVRINGDVALLKGWMKALLELEERRPGAVLDREFIDQYTTGFEEFREQVHAAAWEQITAQSGIERLEIERTAALLAGRRIVICWAMGLTQHRNGVENVRELVNLLLLGGNIGRPGAGAFCVRGHSNVQGDRTMGVWEKITPAFREGLAREFNFSPPTEPGYDTVESIHAMAAGKVRVLISLGGNFLSATPDTHRVAEGLRRCRLTVSIATKLNRFHLVTGQTALILPCLGRMERDEQTSGLQRVTVENTISWVSASSGHLEPISPDVKSEPAIIAGMAQAALAGRSSVDWAALVGDYRRIREAIGRTVAGFERFEERLDEGGFYAPVAPKERVFPTPDGKAHFTVNPIRPLELRDGELIMMTIRTHDQFNTVVYGLDDRYRGIRHGRRVIFLNREDMAARGIEEGSLLDLFSGGGGQQRVVRRFRAVGYDIPPGCCATYFPETNPLVPSDVTADGSHTPISKSVAISLKLSAPEGA